MRQPNEPSHRRTPAWDLITATLIVALAIGIGGASLWTSRHNTPTKKSTPSTFPLSRTLVTVPAGVGRNAYAVIGDLMKAHLNFTVVSASSSAAPAGEVISQSPAAGTQVRGGTVVRLTISKGQPARNASGRPTQVRTYGRSRWGLA